MRGLLLDTNILIDWYNNGPSQSWLEETLKDPAPELVTPWICAVEFLVKATPKQKKSILSLIQNLELKIYELSGFDDMLAVSDVRSRFGLPLPDCMVLATAKKYNLMLVSRDERLVSRGRQWHCDIMTIDPY